MIYPAQTSLIPVQIALARFLEQGGAVFGNYPYWYLGTTPYRYLTGPILPTVLVALHRILPTLSLFEILLLLIVPCFLLGSLGVYLLIKELGGERRIALFSTLLYLFGPIVPLLFHFSDGLFLISFSFLPFILLLYARFLKVYSRQAAVLLGGLISFLLLLNISIIPTLVLGMTTIFLAVTGWEQAEGRLKQTLILVTGCLLLVTLWYTPGFWLARLGVPSLAGRNLIQVLLDLGKLVPTALAIVAAFVSVKFFEKRNLLRDFCFYWIFIYGFLTLIRFISDPDFWLDWSSYNLELQLGLAIGAGLVLTRKNIPSSLTLERAFSLRANVSRLIAPAICGLLFVTWLPLVNSHVINAFQDNVAQTVEYRIGQKLAEIVPPGEQVLLSGTTVFWLNAFFDIPQVRGGVDQASVDPNWRGAVWEIREGTEPERSLEWLRDLDISYLVVHTEESEEHYHDFSYPEKFEGAIGFEKIYEEQGDRIYRVVKY